MSRIRYFMAFAAVALLAGTASLALAQLGLGLSGHRATGSLPPERAASRSDPSWQGSNLTINNGGIALMDGTTNLLRFRRLRHQPGRQQWDRHNEPERRRHLPSPGDLMAVNVGYAW